MSLAAVCIAVATAAQAQTSTADGVMALARGDVRRAVEILRPLAEDWRHPDPYAAFFLAMLYDSGHGVPLDPARACALYHWAAGGSNSIFDQLAFWAPKDNTWSLRWSLYEISGADLNLAATEDALARTASSERPAPGAIDLRGLVDIHANAQGRPAYAIRSEAGTRTVLIETLTEKRALRAQRDARDAADARVDWKAEQDPTRVPKMQYVDADGCYSSFVYAWTGDRAEALTLSRNLAPRQRLTAGTFAIGSAGAFQAEIHVYQRAVRQPFCTADGFEKPEETVWRAVSGIVTVELSPAGVVARQPDARYATIRVTGAEFVSEAGARVRQSLPIAFTALLRAF